VHQGAVALEVEQQAQPQAFGFFATQHIGTGKVRHAIHELLRPAFGQGFDAWHKIKRRSMDVWIAGFDHGTGGLGGVHWGA
jgi:hypothetical protein